LPEPDYASNYQVAYENEEALVDAIREARSTEGVTTPRNADAVLRQFGQIALGTSRTPILILDGCNEAVRIRKDAETLADIEADLNKMAKKALLPLRLAARTKLSHALVIGRNRGQNTKPRSNMTETIVSEDGTEKEILSYMGDAVNDRDQNKRMPDPTRIPAAVIQARDVERQLRQMEPEHMPAAHEFLNLPMEMSQMVYDPETDELYSKGGDLLWLGMRTNDPDGYHARLLGMLGNPVAVKIGASTSPEQIIALDARLNPDNIAGKVTYMLRFEETHSETLETILDTIAEHMPSALIMWDIHGSTETRPDGTKLRAVSSMLRSIIRLSQACRKRGLKLHGLHLETIDDPDRLECVDSPEQTPTHKGNVDPGLNPDQTVYLLDEAEPYLL
jgi:3-deoxy-7-phosphoheptulonate synthase